MTDISLFLSNVNVTVGQNMDMSETSSKSGRDFECVELGDLGNTDEKKEKTPRRVIHFSNGETMEEYSTDEEEEDDKEQEKKDLLAPVDTSKLTWGPYVWFQMWRAATSTISACDYLGERMASLFGITSAKYQYAIDEFYRIKKEREEEEEENRLSEETERYFEEQRCYSNDETRTHGSQQPEGTRPQLEASKSAPDVATTVSVPAIISNTAYVS